LMMIMMMASAGIQGNTTQYSTQKKSNSKKLHLSFPSTQASFTISAHHQTHQLQRKYHSRLS
jgi:hypothetical protein